MDISEEKNSIKLLSNVCGASSEEVAYVKALVDGKTKEKDTFICEGLWACDKLISKKLSVTAFYVCAETLDETESESDLKTIKKMAKYAQKTYLISRKACKKISDRDGADEFFVVAKNHPLTLDDLTKLFGKKENVMGIITDGLEQPGNIGAILRSFDCAGGDFAIITNAKAKINSSRLVRASLGASFMLPVLEANIEDVQNWLIKRNFRCVVTDLSAKKSYREVDHHGKIAIVAGNEHTGISNSWRTMPNAERVIIPMMGSCESLNVGFASTLVAYEIGLKRLEDHKK